MVFAYYACFWRGSRPEDDSLPLRRKRTSRLWLLLPQRFSLQAADVLGFSSRCIRALRGELAQWARSETDRKREDGRRMTAPSSARAHEQTGRR